VLEEDLPGRRQPEPATVAAEQQNTKIIFQGGELTTQGRLGEVQPVRGPADVQLLGDHDE
jgi:hypothetical protein